ncbi:unnamed protein product [Gordionus sp. m RMFG-2023]
MKNPECKWLAPFTFIQAADTQYGMMDTFKENTPEYNWDEEIKLTEKAIELANNLTPKPKFFIVCGDLVNAFPGQKLKSSQISSFKQTFNKLDPKIPLICVCGNHDIGNYPTSKDVLDYRRDFGDDYFSFWVDGVKCIVLNSQYYFDDTHVKEYSKEQDDWLISELEDGKENNAQHIIAFQHIPWFLFKSDEEMIFYDYGETSQGSFNLKKELRFKMLELFKSYGVTKIFCGHYHRNAGGFYQDTLEVVTTSAIGCQLGNDKSGFRLVKVYSDQITHKYLSFDSFDSKDPFLQL